MTYTADSPAVLPTYTGWRWACPRCHEWGRTETRWGAMRALKRHQCPTTGCRCGTGHHHPSCPERTAS